MTEKAFELGTPLAAFGLFFTAIGALLMSLSATPPIIAAYVLWVTASTFILLALPSLTRRAKIAATLRTTRFTHFYALPVTRILSTLWPRLCHPVADDANTLTLFKSTLTWRLYDKALLFAVAYPILALVGMWILTGNSATVGSTVFLLTNDFWPSRAAALAGFALFILSRKAIREAATILLAPASNTDTSTFAVIIAFAGSSVVAFDVAFKIEGAIAATVTIAFALAAMNMDNKHRQGLTRFLLTILLPLFWALALWFLPWADTSNTARAIFLFLAVFPLVNALFDALSYAITLTLLKRGLHAKHPIFLGILDLVAALILFMALALTLTALITAMNALAGVDLINMQALLDGIKQAPANYIWLYIMLFSTILPTALHGLLALLGIQAFVLAPIRRPIATLIDRSPTDTLAAATAPMAVGAIFTAPVVLLCWFAVQIWPLIDDAAKWVGWSIYGVMRDFSQLIGAS